MKFTRIVMAISVFVIWLVACAPKSMPIADHEYILTTDLRDGKFIFLGVSESINGVVNPALNAGPGDKVTIILINGGHGKHDFNVPGLKSHSEVVDQKGETTSVTLVMPDKEGIYPYFDTDHKDLGMSGLLLVGDVVATVSSNAVVDANLPNPTGVTVEYILESALQDGKMVFVGKGGELDGLVNPEIKVNFGDLVRIKLFSGEGAAHNFVIDELGAKSDDVVGQGNSIILEFTPDAEGTFSYYCDIPGHRLAGMEGKFIVGSGISTGSAISQTNVASPVTPAGPVDAKAIDIIRDPADVPAPISKRAPQHIRVDLETVEVSGQLADGTTFTYWTFNGLVPGPFIRVRVGDTVEVHLKNAIDSIMAHSVDFHATTGPGGGAVATQTQPGGETSFTFKALNPGLYVYHCATPMVAHHIANGMYGLILVEPENGLAQVDREFYVMQGELYTAQPMGTSGHLTDDTAKLLNETPEYFVFNGASMGLTSDTHALRANVGETVRIFFGVGGPNFISSFHVIGEIFDRVYDQASLTSPPLTDVQTTLVPPGGATMVEFKLEVPGRYILVDHALSRLQRGLAGFLYVEGEVNLDAFNGTAVPGSGH